MSKPLLVLIAAMATVATAEAPRRVQRADGSTCLQLERDGELLESCRPGEAFRPALPSASLLDPSGARRGLIESFTATISASLSGVALVAMCGNGNCTGPVVPLFFLGEILFVGLTAGFAHGLVDGRAGAPWGVVGALAAGGILFVVFVALAALPLTSGVLLVLGVFTGVLPAIGAVVALEVRDTSLRREAAGAPPSVTSAEVLTF